MSITGQGRIPAGRAVGLIIILPQEKEKTVEHLQKLRVCVYWVAIDELSSLIQANLERKRGVKTSSSCVLSAQQVKRVMPSVCTYLLCSRENEQCSVNPGGFITVCREMPYKLQIMIVNLHNNRLYCQSIPIEQTNIWRVFDFRTEWTLRMEIKARIVGRKLSKIELTINVSLTG